MDEKIGNSFFCVLFELKNVKITSFQNLYEKLTKLHNDIHYKTWLAIWPVCCLSQSGSVPTIHSIGINVTVRSFVCARLILLVC